MVANKNITSAEELETVLFVHEKLIRAEHWDRKATSFFTIFYSFIHLGMHEKALN